MSRFDRWSRAKRGLPVDDASAQEDATTDAMSPAMVDDPASMAKRPEDPGTGEEVDEKAPPAPGSLDHTLPDPETLEAGSDFSAFMSPGVSSTLRRKALRQLWTTGDYNLRDGLNDYDQDFKAQLKPMAAEMAEKVRQWSKKVDGALDELTSEELPDSRPADEINQAVREEEKGAHADDVGAQEASLLHDQADNTGSDKDQTLTSTSSQR